MRACDNPTSDVCCGVRGCGGVDTGRGIMALRMRTNEGQQWDGAFEGSCTSAHADAALVRMCDRCVTGCSSAPHCRCAVQL
eukprot:827129-Prymnesium_polylepis.1